MGYKRIDVVHASGRLSFTTRDGDQRPWWRDLDLDGQPLYRIGNLCDTCEAIFSRMAAAELPLAPADLALRLRNGLKDLSQGVLDTVAAILPNGRYAATLLTIQPVYTPAEQRLSSTSGKHAFRQVSSLTATLKIAEVFLPLIGEDQFDLAVIDRYEKVIQQGSQPTALALSVLDVRALSGKAYEWQLVHFLLDGHHKIMAASRLHRPITLLSFFALDESFAPLAEIEQVLKLRFGRS